MGYSRTMNGSSLSSHPMRHKGSAANDTLMPSTKWLPSEITSTMRRGDLLTGHYCFPEQQNIRQLVFMKWMTLEEMNVKVMPPGRRPWLSNPTPKQNWPRWPRKCFICPDTWITLNTNNREVMSCDLNKVCRAVLQFCLSLFVLLLCFVLFLCGNLGKMLENYW